MRVERAKVESYICDLKDKYRPPSQGGNTRAWHAHYLKIEGKIYSFLALGSRKWVYARDTVSFSWDWDDTGKYRNIDPKTIETWDKDGNVVVRGLRGTKPWRTANARLPGSRREQRD